MVMKIIETLIFICLCVLVFDTFVENKLALFISKILVSLFFGLLFFWCHRFYMGGAMIQYYRDLIATVTYDEAQQFVDELDFSLRYKFETDIGDKYRAEAFSYDVTNPIWFAYRYHQELFFTELSELLNKPIDHIVREMKSVQQPDKSDNKSGFMYCCPRSPLSKYGYNHREKTQVTMYNRGTGRYKYSIVKYYVVPQFWKRQL